MNEVPIALLTYNRADFLERSLVELERTNTPFPIYIFDDGSHESSKLELLSKLENDNRYEIIRLEHKGYKDQFTYIMKFFKDRNYDYYVFIEDDAIFAKNWYQWGMRELGKLQLRSDFITGVFALYTGHPFIREQVAPFIFKHDKEHFYGTCCTIISPLIYDEYYHHAYEKGWNPDVALREMSMSGSKFRIAVSIPTLAQHIGDKSLVGAPAHRSPLFLGGDKDALEIL